MKGKMKRMIGAMFAALTLVSPLLFGASAFAQAANQNESDASFADSSVTLGLADRSKIQLDEGEVWVDGANFSQYAIKAGDDYVSCNNNCRNLNTVNNHFGIRRHVALDDAGPEYGHAWAFTCEWHGDKGAYAIKVGWKGVDEHEKMKYKDCTWKYLNLTDKKTSNHVKIKTWGIKNPQKKAEQLFWVSKGPNGYRLWSALAGRPLGYTSDDNKNLKTLDNREAGTTQYFNLLEITPTVCHDARAECYIF